ncbi:hypothetical protein MFIFM68171_02292 [Madurella fahalii]|uniref:Uncharacterized protein n=1 Tax=Madurella fahalii TaxID=1157608 RepID=A0ABQ0G2T8_9PEZI
MLLQNYWGYASDEALPASIPVLLDAFRDDDALLRIIREWITTRDRRPPSVVEGDPVRRLIDNPIPEHVFYAVLFSIPSNKQCWTRTLLTWTLLCLRPLKADEFRLVSHLAKGDSTTGPECLYDVLGYFGALIQIQHGEVRFGHSRIRTWLESDPAESGSRSWWKPGSRSQRHLDILMTCLECLIATDEPSPTSEWSAAHGFPYAAQYWTFHYREAQGVGTAAYASVANPFTCPDPDARQPLPLAAHFGLEDLVEAFRSDKTGESITTALVKAAKQGHLGIVRELLPLVTTQLSLEDPKLEKLLRAAVSSGSQDVPREVMKLLPEHNRYPDAEVRSVWISDMFLKACWAKNEDLVARLLDLGADPRATLVEEDPLGPIGLATTKNAIGVIKVFLDRGINIAPLAPLQDYIVDPVFQPLLEAASGGFVRTTEALLKRRVDLSVSDEEGNALCLAITGNSLRICERLVEEGIDVNSNPSGGDTPLLLAVTAEKHPLGKARFLLDHGATTEAREPANWNRTALLIASAREADDIVDVVKLLLEHNADVMARDSDGWTPLYTAAAYGPLGIVQLLVDAGSYLTVCDAKRETPLHAAVRRPEVVRHLLNQGVDPSKKYEAAASPLEAAARANQPEVVKLMVERPLEDADALSASLLLAVQYEHEEVVRLLLDAEADVNYTHDEATLSPLSEALSRGNDAIVRMLLEFCPNLDSMNIDGNTPLHHITSLTSMASVKRVVNARAKLDATNKWRNTPLVEAIRAANWEVVRYLLSKKDTLLTLNTPGISGALHNICAHRLDAANTVEIINLLVENGADVNLDRESTPLILVCRHDPSSQKEAVIRYLVEHGAAVEGPAYTTLPLHLASMTCSPGIIKLLLEKGADVAAMDGMRRRASHLACYDSLAALEALGASDEDFAARDAFGRIPLHYAVLSGQLDLVEVVLDNTKVAGLGINTPDEDGWTALLWAARATDIFKQPDNGRRGGDDAAKIVAFLLSRGADPRGRGRVQQSMGGIEDWSAGDVARYHNALDLATTLEKEDLLCDEHIKPRKSGISTNVFCGGCYLRIWGVYYDSQALGDFSLCFKCYGSETDLAEPEYDGKPPSAADDERFVAGMTDRNGSNAQVPEFDEGVVSDDD